jgi:hypothetical protein
LLSDLGDRAFIARPPKIIIILGFKHQTRA